ncbi:antitoxin [Escherichia coli]|nr:antitoxin [Escherichia coli]
MSKFIVIHQRLWCNERGHGIEYSSDFEEFSTRHEAIKHGLKITDSDDFNIGVIEDGRLVSFDWMDKPVGESQETVKEIAEALDLESAESKGAQS